MTISKRQRNDPRRDLTRAALIEAAERLFAEHGVKGASTRQIAAEIGALNTNVVAYHFGSKDALVEAVFHHRLPGLDRRRGEMLALLDANPTPPSLTELMAAFATPLFEQRDANGGHSFARFLAGLERSGMSAARGLIVESYPHSDRLTQLLVAALPAEIRSEGHLRLRLVVSLLATALQVIDHDCQTGTQAGRRIFDNAVSMAAAAFAASSTSGASS